ncbi:hypothetical protein HDU86_002721 [Geranomyces michiganensis]|nr:hypothetical protein HDU86_002721 [Geranomyces michiganensis]
MLVRVGTAAALSMATPPPRVRLPTGVVASHGTSQNQSLVIVNGKAYAKGQFGRSLRKVATPAALKAAQTPRRVKAISINGVEFVRDSAGKSKKSWWNSTQAVVNDAAAEEQEQLMRLPIRPNFALSGNSSTDGTNIMDQDMDMIPLNVLDEDQVSDPEGSDGDESDGDGNDELESGSEDELDPALATEGVEAEAGEDVIEILSDSDSDSPVIDLTDE